MVEALHPEATHNVPFFITAPGDTDVLMVVTALFLLGAVVAFGVFYFRLHSLPEHIAHKAQNIHQGGLAGTGRPHDSDELTLFDRQTQATQGLDFHVADPIDFPHIFAFDQRAHRHPSL